MVAIFRLRDQEDRRTKSQVGEPGSFGAEKFALRVLSTEGWPGLGYWIKNRIPGTGWLQTLLSCSVPLRDTVGLGWMGSREGTSSAPLSDPAPVWEGATGVS